MEPIDCAMMVLKQAYHPAIHGLMRRKRIADEFNEGMPGPYKPSDFVEEGYGGYEPKGAGERDPANPTTLEAMERSGELKRQSTGLAPRDVELRQQQDFKQLYKQQGAEVAQQYDLPTYLKEAMKQVGDQRKKRTEAQKLRDQINDHEEDGKIYDYYRQNHPEWFNNWMQGGGE